MKDLSSCRCTIYVYLEEEEGIHHLTLYLLA